MNMLALLLPIKIQNWQIDWVTLQEEEEEHRADRLPASDGLVGIVADGEDEVVFNDQDRT